MDDNMYAQALESGESGKGNCLQLGSESGGWARRQWPCQSLLVVIQGPAQTGTQGDCEHRDAATDGTPWQPRAETPRSHCRGPGFDPGRGAGSHRLHWEPGPACCKWGPRQPNTYTLKKKLINCNTDQRNSKYDEVNFYLLAQQSAHVIMLHGKWVFVAQSYPILCDPMDWSPPGSSVHGILQARILEWVAISSSRESSWPRDWTLISCTGKRILYHWTAWEAPLEYDTQALIMNHTQDQQKAPV